MKYQKRIDDWSVPAELLPKRSLKFSELHNELRRLVEANIPYSTLDYDEYERNWYGTVDLKSMSAFGCNRSLNMSLGGEMHFEIDPEKPLREQLEEIVSRVDKCKKIYNRLAYDLESADA